MGEVQSIGLGLAEIFKDSATLIGRLGIREDAEPAQILKAFATVLNNLKHSERSAIDTKVAILAAEAFDLCIDSLSSSAEDTQVSQAAREFRKQHSSLIWEVAESYLASEKSRPAQKFADPTEAFWAGTKTVMEIINTEINRIGQPIYSIALAIRRTTETAVIESHMPAFQTAVIKALVWLKPFGHLRGDTQKLRADEFFESIIKVAIALNLPEVIKEVATRCNDKDSAELAFGQLTTPHKANHPGELGAAIKLAFETTRAAKK